MFVELISKSLLFVSTLFPLIMENHNINREAQLEAEIARLKRFAVSREAYIEEIKALEEKNRQNQVRFKTIFEKSTLGNKILGPDLSILEVNKALISMLGYTDKQDLLNRKVIEFAHPDSVDHWRELQLKLWKESITSFSLDTCLVRKDKSLVWCHVTSILFQDEGRTLGYTILEDITERKILEDKAKRLYQAQLLLCHDRVYQYLIHFVTRYRILGLLVQELHQAGAY